MKLSYTKLNFVPVCRWALEDGDGNGLGIRAFAKRRSARDAAICVTQTGAAKRTRAKDTPLGSTLRLFFLDSDN